MQYKTATIQIQLSLWVCSILHLLIPGNTFVLPSLVQQQKLTANVRTRQGQQQSSSSPSDNDCGYQGGVVPPVARLVGHIPPDEKPLALQSLQQAGYTVVTAPQDNSETADPEEKIDVSYRWNSAVGMMQRIPGGELDSDYDHPRFIPLVQGEENVLVANGWSFLDVDESEKLSPFDVDAANLEGLYQPKWGQQDSEDNSDEDEKLSSLGFSLSTMTSQEILQLVNITLTSDLAKQVLLEGATDPPGTKQTNNGYSFKGSVRDLEPGVFTCALTGLPLFATTDLSVTTATSGWLSFVRPISQDHVILVHPDPSAVDQRIEVLCAKSNCHLGHYFPGEGYCINASVLNFLSSKKQQSSSANGIDPSSETITSTRQLIQPPFSYETLNSIANDNKDSCFTMSSLSLLKDTLKENISMETIVLGAGCFWHVEFALGRLAGVINTIVGYAGGSSPNPTYEDVCRGDTGHAEVVLVEFDPMQLSPRTLVDCFLAMHDPTKVRAHGKHAATTGQYRSCIFVPFTTTTSSSSNDINIVDEAQQAIEDCQLQLGKELSCELRTIMATNNEYSELGNFFYKAEERHQRHDEKKMLLSQNTDLVSVENNRSTLSPSDWLELYGRRSQSVLGSAQTLHDSV